MLDHHGVPAFGETDADGCAFCDLIADPGRDQVCLPVGDHFHVIPAAAQRPTNLQQLPASQGHDLLLALTTVTDAVRDAFNASGATVRCNLGPPAQSMAHLHFHVIPRHLEDQNLATASRPIPLLDRQQQMRNLAPRLASRITADGRLETILPSVPQVRMEAT